MAIMNFINRQFIDVIEWVDDSRDTLSYRFPDDDKEIKNEAQLIVRESQVAQFVYVGQFADTLGPGKHTLKTENIPILSDLLGWKYKFQSPFKADVYYVITRVFTGNKWGTSNPVMMRDADFGVVRMRAFGTYDFRIVDPVKFLKEVAGTDHHFRLDEFNDVMRSRLVSVFSETLAKSKVPALDVATRYGELGEALLEPINVATREKYGIELTAFVVENVSVPPELEQAIDHGVGGCVRAHRFQHIPPRARPGPSWASRIVHRRCRRAQHRPRPCRRGRRVAAGLPGPLRDRAG